MSSTGTAGSDPELPVRAGISLPGEPAVTGYDWLPPGMACCSRCVIDVMPTLTTGPRSVQHREVGCLSSEWRCGWSSAYAASRQPRKPRPRLAAEPAALDTTC